MYGGDASPLANDGKKTQTTSEVAPQSLLAGKKVMKALGGVTSPPLFSGRG